MRQDEYPQYQDDPGAPRRRLFTRRTFFLLMFLGFIVSVAVFGWIDLYRSWLETRKPTIEVLADSFPRGIGLTPVQLRVRIADADTGLDEAVVRIKQRNFSREIFRKTFHGEHRYDIPLDFNGPETQLEEGPADIEVRVFDKSLFSNTEIQTYRINVDFHKPKIEALSTQHNARRGGSQLVFYRAYDEGLAVSGVKVGNTTFNGYPARGIDKDLEDPNLFVALYAIDLGQEDIENLTVKVFAEDQVGNGSSQLLYNKIQDRQQKHTAIDITEDFMREQIVTLGEQNYKKLEGMAQDLEADPTQHGKLVGRDRLIETFKLVNSGLREINNNEVASALLKKPRFESFWAGPFARHPGVTQNSFGEIATFSYDDQALGESTFTGNEMMLQRDARDVVALNDGVVVMSDNIGVYGRMIAIDHGLGLCSIYSHLNNVTVNKGEVVKKGQQIGVAGKTGFARNTGVGIEMRVHGVPVDPAEWMDPTWFNQHITLKINNLKRDLGIPVYIPLDKHWP